MQNRNKHIIINDKKDCCGCTACESICPKDCITLSTDSLGFKYPSVDEAICIQCGACTRACPMINISAPLEVKETYAALNRDIDQRLQSSSGGIFIVLAQRIISKGGVVYGAVFTPDWMVEHRRAENMADVYPMMGSKYLQSDLKMSYRNVLADLKDGRDVLFTGTPCQVSGLKKFLKKDFTKLLTIEVICHGVPSPASWASYLSKITGPIESIRFRDKTQGWKNFRFTIHTLNTSDSNKTDTLVNETFGANLFMKAFLRNWNLRPSCYDCKSKDGHSQADLTIGDFWGIEKTNILPDDDRGVSCIICRSRYGLDFINDCRDKLKLIEAPYSTVVAGNPSVEKSVILTDCAKRFQRLFPNKGFYEMMNTLEHPSLWRKGIAYIKRKLIKHLPLCK